MPLPVVFLMGPTAIGKTDIAIRLHKQLPVDIISVDSAMVYRDMNIGTGKPTADVLATAPHRLIGICDPADTYSAARFCVDAKRAIQAIHAKNRIPLLVGGTGLYFRSLELGMSNLPEANHSIRQRLQKEQETLGLSAMHQRLERIDPIAASKIHPNDPQRIQRALEVYEISGMTRSEHYAKNTSQPLPYEAIKLILNNCDRPTLHTRVKKRFLHMLEQGFIEEVRRLQQQYDLCENTPSMRTVGYRQIWQFLEGRIDHEQMVKHAITATRQLVKRQFTWLQKEDNARSFNGAQPLHDIVTFLSGKFILFY